MKNKKDEIKQALLQGGLVIAERGSGKTLALAEILVEQPNSVVIVGTQQQRLRMNSLLEEKGLSKQEIKERVVHSESLASELLFLFPEKDIYVDEYWQNKWDGPFKAAVTSLPFHIEVIK